MLLAFLVQCLWVAAGRKSETQQQRRIATHGSGSSAAAALDRRLEKNSSRLDEVCAGCSAHLADPAAIRDFWIVARWRPLVGGAALVWRCRRLRRSWALLLLSGHGDDQQQHWPGDYSGLEFFRSDLYRHRSR